ncbi:MAG: class I adenylate-forming enzyme family protein [Gemmatimonadota bacterium]
MERAVSARPRDVAAVLRERAETHPDRTFLLHRDRRWSFADVAAEGRALACAFQRLGIEKGDRVATDLPNWPEFVVTAVAAAEVGATVVPLNPSQSPRELQFVLRNTETTLVVSAEQWGGIDYLELFEPLLTDLPGLQYLVTVGEEDLWYDDRIFQFEDLVSSGRGGDLAPVEIAPEKDPLAILYTSGTSGKVKGVVLSHANVLATAGATAAALRMTPDDVTLCSVPLFNIFGLSAALMTALLSGSAVVLQDRFEAAEALELIERHGVTMLHGVPTMFVLLTRDPALARRDLSSLRTGIIAGAPVDEELVVRLRKELIPDLEIAYGLTETSPTVAITAPENPPAKRSQTVGRPLPGLEIRISGEGVDSLPVESVGEVQVKGFNVMQGYFRQPEATGTAFTPDGFLRTGDLGMLDDEGYLHIVGRESDVIIRGGYNVHPREVEDHLRSHPAVMDAVVVGVPNEVLGELLCACIVPVEGALITEPEIREFCRSALAQYKVPDLVRFMSEFPMTSSGKARRAELARIVRRATSTPRAERGDESRAS